MITNLCMNYILIQFSLSESEIKMPNFQCSNITVFTSEETPTYQCSLFLLKKLNINFIIKAIQMSAGLLVLDQPYYITCLILHRFSSCQP